MEDAYCLNREKIAQAKAFLAESGIDCWIVKTKEGSDPCMPLMFGLSISGDAVLVITPTAALAITSSIDAQEVQQSQLFDQVITYSRTGFADLVYSTIDRLKPKRIAINYSIENHLSDGLTVGSYRALRKMLGSYAECLESSEHFLQRLRSIKSPLEVQYIQKAIEITLDIYDEVFGSVKKGMTEIEIGQLFVEGMIKRGVVNGITRKLTPPIVMNHNIAHRGPSDSVLKEGDYLIFDFSVDYNGYCSDIARTCYYCAREKARPQRPCRGPLRPSTRQSIVPWEPSNREPSALMSIVQHASISLIAATRTFFMLSAIR